MPIGAGKTELLADRKVTRFLSHSEVYNLQKPGRKFRNRLMTYDDDWDKLFDKLRVTTRTVSNILVMR